MYEEREKQQILQYREKESELILPHTSINTFLSQYHSSLCIRLQSKLAVGYLPILYIFIHTIRIHTPAAPKATVYGINALRKFGLQALDPLPLPLRFNFGPKSAYLFPGRFQTILLCSTQLEKSVYTCRDRSILLSLVV